MKAETFVQTLGADFFTGVPDSQLKALCDYLIDRYGVDGKHHIIAANEGNCTAVAAGYHLATGKTPVVYMQNSGEGNVINPVASLLSDQVYGIPCIFVIGWRGEPGVHDEPQHIYQGKVTVQLMEDMQIPTCILSKDTSAEELADKMTEFNAILQSGGQVAFIIRKGALEFDTKVKYANEYSLLREDIIRCIAAAADTDPIVSTTGKASRELFEIREHNRQSHCLDFLTVGSMGHSSSIALGIALQKPEQRIWIIDGDGALLMHMGSMAVIGSMCPENLIHIVINNGAHETVGGQPTAVHSADLVAIAKGCGYPYAVCVDTTADLQAALEAAKNRHTLSMIEVKCAIGSREDLGRPTTSAMDNKKAFMEYLAGK